MLTRLIPVWELYKTAATVDQLQAGAKKLGIIRVKLPKDPESFIGKVMGPLAKGGRVKTGPVTTTLMGGGAATAATPKTLKKLKTQGIAAAGRTYGPEVEAASKDVNSRIDVYSPKRLQILVGKGDTTKLLSPHIPYFQDLSGEGRRATNIAFRHHEGFERGAAKKAPQFGFGHMSPEVLMKEHNMLSAMTGPGSGEARSALAQTRGSAGDATALEKMVSQRYGSRAPLVYGHSQKIPKAMRKDLLRHPQPEVWNRFPV